MSSDSTVVVGKHAWATEDLRVTVTRDGKPLRLADTDEAWRQAIADNAPAYRPSTHPGGGLLYNLSACNGIAPAGWSVPDEKAWLALAEAAGASPELGAKLGFRDRAQTAYFGTSGSEDGKHGGYWSGHLTMEESWGTRIDQIGANYFAGVTRWGCACDYGLYVRCVKPA